MLIKLYLALVQQYMEMKIKINQGLDLKPINPYGTSKLISEKIIIV